MKSVDSKLNQKVKWITTLTAIALLSAPSAFATGRIVDCSISNLPGNELQFKGKCNFIPEAGGSFTLMDAAGRDKLYGTVGMVSVNLTGKDTAEVSGLVLDKSGGHNSRWGSAKRSRLDRACWDGGDFRICAW